MSFAGDFFETQPGRRNMQRIKGLVLTGVLAISCGTMLLGAPTSPAPTLQEQSYWRHHNGRWNYWDHNDRRWYYTDGSHWYYNNGKAWDVYKFDKSFGKNNFQKGNYAFPAPAEKVIVPTHEVYVPR